MNYEHMIMGVTEERTCFGLSTNQRSSIFWSYDLDSKEVDIVEGIALTKFIYELKDYIEGHREKLDNIDSMEPNDVAMEEAVIAIVKTLQRRK